MFFALDGWEQKEEEGCFNLESLVSGGEGKKQMSFTPWVVGRSILWLPLCVTYTLLCGNSEHSCPDWFLYKTKQGKNLMEKIFEFKPERLRSVAEFHIKTNEFE